MPEPALSVLHLSTRFHTRQGVVKAVDDVSFSVGRGKVLGIVGESGSGKSMVAYSIMGLVDPPGQIAGGSILFRGENLLSLAPERMRALRGDRIAMVFQDPMLTLNPVLRIETQMVEAIRAHREVTAARARDLAAGALGRLGIADPAARLRSYPHEFSGGMRQRVAIAIALINTPDLLIADEPTTAVDVTTQGQILAEVQKLCGESGTALVWITHDLAVVAGLADEVCVMYAGRIVEQGPVAAVLEAPLHPYTRGLIDSVPSRHPPGTPLPQIPGMMPSLLELPSGCAFRDRCPRATDVCRNDPPLEPLRSGQLARCFHPLIEEPAPA